MHKLAVVQSHPMLDDLMRRLDEAGIDATSTTERSAVEFYVGTAPSVIVWIMSAGDVARATEILREVEAQTSWTACPKCRYDLRGHAGRSVCPECGHDLSAPAPDVVCPACGESVPGGFEICWNCGTGLPDADASAR